MGRGSSGVTFEAGLREWESDMGYVDGYLNETFVLDWKLQL